MRKQNHDHQAAPTVVGINSMILPGAEVLPAWHEHTHLMGPNRRMRESMAWIEKKNFSSRKLHFLDSFPMDFPNVPRFSQVSHAQPPPRGACGPNRLERKRMKLDMVQW